MDKLKDWMRELLLPAAALAVLASLWVMAWARNMDDDANRNNKPLPMLSLQQDQGAADDESVAATPHANAR